jgi:hypothetical protein
MCATCPIVAMGKLCPPLLGRHSSDGTVTAGRLPIATESYGPLVQMPIVVVSLLENRVGKSSGDRCELIKFVGFVCAAQTPTCMKIKGLLLLWVPHIYGCIEYILRKVYMCISSP